MKSRKKETPSQDIYDLEYYSNIKDSEDVKIVHDEALNLLKPAPNEKILDIGCGRGELVKRMLGVGVNAFGIDYSSAAVTIAKNVCGSGRIVRANAIHLPFTNEKFDKIVLTDVVEHLDQEDLDKCLKEVKRVLKNDGVVLIHTPNKWGIFVNNLYKKIQHKNNNLSKNKSQRNKKSEETVVYHVNEQSPISLTRNLRKNGFKVEMWFGTRISKKIPFRIRKRLIFLRGMWCVCKKR